MQPVSTAQLYASGDPTKIFGIGAPGDLVFDPAWGDWRTPTTELVRKAGFSRDIAARTFWSRVVASGVLAGRPAIVQGYTAPGDVMISSVDAVIATGPGALKDALSPVRMLLCGALNGYPDFTQVVADVSIVPGAGAGPNVPSATLPYKFQLPFPVLKPAGAAIFAVFLSDGPGYAIRGQRYPTDNFSDAQPTLGGGVMSFLPNGQPVYLTGGEGPSELALRFNRASFGGGGVVRVPCQPLTLAGGIDAVDIVAPALLPAGCSVEYETQIGGVTVPLGEAGGAHPLTGAQQSLPLTKVITFTDAVAPMIDISGVGTGAYARLTKAGTAFNHISITRTPAVPVTKVVETVALANWDAASASLTAKLQTGAGLATETAPSSVVDEAIAGGGLRRTFTWLLGAAVTDHRARLIGATTDQTKVFYGTQADFSATP